MDHPVRIAVLDSGINPRHPHLRDVEIDGFDVVSRGDRVWLESGFDDRNGHGTAVAAAIAGHEINGSLLAFRVLDHRLRSDYRCLAFAVVEAARRGAWLINLSLGTRSAAGGRHLAQAAAAALQTGATLIAAAPPSGRGWPSDLDEVISTVADPACPPGGCRRIEVEGKAPDGETRQLLRFGAHGMAVPPAERNSSGNLAGNSLASAHLTGLATRILAEEPGLNPRRLAEALEARYGIEG